MQILKTDICEKFIFYSNQDRKTQLIFFRPDFDKMIPRSMGRGITGNSKNYFISKYKSFEDYNHSKKVIATLKKIQ